MSEQAWHGTLIFNTNTERDNGGQRIEDFIQGKLDVVPWPDANYTTAHAGVEYRNNMTIGTESGPGFLWSAKMPDDATLMSEAAAVADAVNASAIEGTHGFQQI